MIRKLLHRKPKSQTGPSPNHAQGADAGRKPQQPNAGREDEFTRLHPDLQERILSSLPAKALAAAACTSRGWRAAVAQPNLWEPHHRASAWSPPPAGDWQQDFGRRSSQLARAWREGSALVVSRLPSGPTALSSSPRQDSYAHVVYGLPHATAEVSLHTPAGHQQWRSDSTGALVTAGDWMATLRRTGEVAVARFGAESLQIVPAPQSLGAVRSMSLAASPSGAWLARNNGGRLRVWNTHAFTAPHSFHATGMNFSAIQQVLDDGRVLLKSGPTIKLVDAARSTEVELNVAGEGRHLAVATPPEGARVVALRHHTDGSGTLAHGDLTAPGLSALSSLGSLPPLTSGPLDLRRQTKLTALHDGSYVVGMGDRVAKWDGGALTMLAEGPAVPVQEIIDLHASPSGLLLVSGSSRPRGWGSDWTLAAYDFDTGRLMGTIKRDRGHSLLGTLSDDRLLVASEEGTEVWKLAPGAPPAQA